MNIYWKWNVVYQRNIMPSGFWLVVYQKPLESVDSGFLVWLLICLKTLIHDMSSVYNVSAYWQQSFVLHICYLAYKETLNVHKNAFWIPSAEFWEDLKEDEKYFQASLKVCDMKEKLEKKKPTILSMRQNVFTLRLAGNWNRLPWRSCSVPLWRH